MIGIMLHLVFTKPSDTTTVYQFHRHISLQEGFTNTFWLDPVNSSKFSQTKNIS